MANISQQLNRPWLVESMRLTAFFKQGEVVTSDVLLNWWKAAVGSAPASTTSEQHGLKNRLRGPHMGGRIELSTTPSRLDWKVAVVPGEPSEKSLEIGGLGPFDEVRKQFLTFSESWLKIAPALKRLALGMTLVHPAADKAAAMMVLQDRIGRTCLNLHEANELIYRMNRRRQYALNPNTEITINRVSTWSVIAYMTLVGTFDPQQPEMQTTEVPGGVAAQLELDINSSPSANVELPQSSLVQLVQHLAVLGTEIAAKGDIA